MNRAQPRPTGIWYHGAPGTGKTRRALQHSPPCLTYVYEGGAWDGLEPHHSTIVIDALPASNPETLISHRALCRLVDTGPRFVQTSSGRVQVFASTVIVTSTVGPDVAYEEETNFTKWGSKQLLRRFSTVTTSQPCVEESDSISLESGSDSEWTPGD